MVGSDNQNGDNGRHGGGAQDVAGGVSEDVIDAALADAGEPENVVRLKNRAGRPEKVGQDEVIRAGKAILAEGGRVSPSAIRNRLGAGKHDRIAAFWAEYEEEQRRLHPPPPSEAEQSEIPPRAMDKVKEILATNEAHILGLAHALAREIRAFEKAQWQSLYESVEKAKRDLEVEKADFEAHIRALESEVETLNTTALSAQRSIDALKGSNATLTERLKNAEAAATKAQAAQKDAETRVGALSGELVQERALSASLKGRLDAMVDTLRDAKAEARQAGDALATEKATVQTLTSSITRLEAERADLGQRLHAAQTDLAAANAGKAAAEGQARNAQDRANEAQQRAGKAEGEIAALRQQIADLSSRKGRTNERVGQDD